MKKTVVTIMILVAMVIPFTIAFAGGGIVKSNGKDAAPLLIACDRYGGIYCNAYQIPGAKGKVNLIQPNGNVDVILGISADGLAPNSMYRVFFDLNGGSPGPWVNMGTFWTDEFGSGDFNYTAPAGTFTTGTYTRTVAINRTDINATVLASEDISFEISDS